MGLNCSYNFPRGQRCRYVLTSGIATIGIVNHNYIIGLKYHGTGLYLALMFVPTAIITVLRLLFSQACIIYRASFVRQMWPPRYVLYLSSSVSDSRTCYQTELPQFQRMVPAIIHLLRTNRLLKICIVWKAQLAQYVQARCQNTLATRLCRPSVEKQ